MELEDLLAYILPEALLNHFSLVDIEEIPGELHLYLDEKDTIPAGYSDRPIRLNGFTSAQVVQDYPIRDRAVYLHIRRRRWILLDTNFSFTQSYDIAHFGTKISKELAAFLKEAYRY